ncbi:F-box domain [Arabidopsis thaliana x Arabidopsis arenosa]|uniref:F-box domain n=1 Tax=Arabidopsis thaliana x Arabidopsis arenosa TaxID=1240361 RepID=A0A8T1ZSU4_9BRAS|nr:F-box domain [Arabidopsis thaliana x Arabidopsis arenosa]
MDRISNLPDDIIYHVISFLSAKEATCLKYASKKWLNLVTIIPSAVFVDSSSSASSGSFQDFADRIKLAQLASHRMRRFSLKLQSLDFAQYSIVNDCLRQVLECGVLDLELDINVKGDYSLPFEIFTCQSVVKLKLGSGFVIDILPKNALLPALKTLLLDSVRFEFDNTGGCAFTRLLSACPVLEELIIDGFNCELWNWSHTVYSRILKKLTIRRAYSKDSDDYDDYDFEKISFDTPSLTYLEYRDYIHDEFPDVNLKSLVEAKLQFNMLTAWMNTDLTNLFKGLKHVQILRLKFIDTLMLFDTCDEADTVFENMSHLDLPSEADVCWDPLKLFVKKSPNLKTLTIEDLHYEYREYLDLKSVCECLEGYSFLLSCPVEILTITQFSGRIGEMVQIKHVLEKLQCLVLLEVHVEERRVDNKLQILADLLMLPRASSKCKVQVKFV